MGPNCINRLMKEENLTCQIFIITEPDQHSANSDSKTSTQFLPNKVQKVCPCVKTSVRLPEGTLQDKIHRMLENLTSQRRMLGTAKDSNLTQTIHTILRALQIIHIKI